MNDESLKSDLCELIKRTVEEMPNGLLDEEVDDLMGAERHERVACGDGRYGRKPVTTSGGATARMHGLKGARLATAIIERCRRCEAGVGALPTSGAWGRAGLRARGACP